MYVQYIYIYSYLHIQILFLDTRCQMKGKQNFSQSASRFSPLLTYFWLLFMCFVERKMQQNTDQNINFSIFFYASPPTLSTDCEPTAVLTAPKA